MRLTARLPLLVLSVVVACRGRADPGTAQGSHESLGVAQANAATAHGELALGPASVDPIRRTAITRAVARVAPAVVTVQTEVVENGPSDPFDQFFGGSSQRVLPGLGSGFIIRADGVILTNAHVVHGARRISVALRDGTTYPAELVGEDEINDLAVLRIRAQRLPVASLGNSDSLLIGEWAIAIGNPYGFLLGNTEPSVTTGVISATGRNLVARPEGPGVYVDMIQTDAPINPGNSGGPLVVATGDVVGVNSSIYSPSGGSVGLGFAIPINRARRVAEDLLAHGQVARPWVGVKLNLPSSRLPGRTLRSGVVVESVVPGSPADKAGLQPGDVLVKSRGRALRNPFDWEAELLDLRVGEEVPLVVRRGDREFTTNVRIANLPEVSAPKVQVLRELELVTLTPTIRAERGIVSRRGALIFNVSDRVSRELGIQKGDVIVQVNRTPIESAQDVAKAIDSYGDRAAIRMYFERGGRIYSTDFMIQ
ncbi:MAG TPA: trypsin-like peptidase domain-containing protein [Gemmatimonadaceae bacterium]|nr:trypsin-like peptidase domain-containing protein [Gemmatimonadaceae bacterium]